MFKTVFSECADSNNIFLVEFARYFRPMNFVNSLIWKIVPMQLQNITLIANTLTVSLLMNGKCKLSLVPVFWVNLMARAAGFCNSLIHPSHFQFLVWKLLEIYWWSRALFSCLLLLWRLSSRFYIEAEKNFFKAPQTSENFEKSLII